MPVQPWPIMRIGRRVIGNQQRPVIQFFKGILEWSNDDTIGINPKRTIERCRQNVKRFEPCLPPVLLSDRLNPFVNQRHRQEQDTFKVAEPFSLARCQSKVKHRDWMVTPAPPAT